MSACRAGFAAWASRNDINHSLPWEENALPRYCQPTVRTVLVGQNPPTDTSRAAAPSTSHRICSSLMHLVVESVVPALALGRIREAALADARVADAVILVVAVRVLYLTTNNVIKAATTPTTTLMSALTSIGGYQFHVCKFAKLRVQYSGGIPLYRVASDIAVVCCYNGVHWCRQILVPLYRAGRYSGCRYIGPSNLYIDTTTLFIPPNVITLKNNITSLRPGPAINISVHLATGATTGNHNVTASRVSRLRVMYNEIYRIAN